MIKVKLRDDIREFEAGISAMDVAKSIGAGLYKAACLCKINGEICGIYFPAYELSAFEEASYFSNENKEVHIEVYSKQRHK